MNTVKSSLRHALGLVLSLALVLTGLNTSQAEAAGGTPSASINVATSTGYQIVSDSAGTHITYDVPRDWSTVDIDISNCDCTRYDTFYMTVIPARKGMLLGIADDQNTASTSYRSHWSTDGLFTSANEQIISVQLTKNITGLKLYCDIGNCSGFTAPTSQQTFTIKSMGFGNSSHPEIIIDGSSQDWKYAPKLCENAGLFAEVSAVAYGDSLYIERKLKDVTNYSKENYYFDVDGNHTNGLSNKGADYLLQGDTLYKYSGTNGSWDWTESGKSFETSRYDDNAFAEYRIPLNAFNNVTSDIRVNIGVIDANWDELDNYPASVSEFAAANVFGTLELGAQNNATPKPTAAPTAKPTAKPTAAPTAKPTAAPTAKPTAKPTAAPTAKPTAKPTAAPTAKPTAKPTAAPTATPAGNSIPTNPSSETSTINVVMANPGADPANSMNIAFHSTVKKATLYYWKSTDTSAKTVPLTGTDVKSTTEGYYKRSTTTYSFKYTLQGLSSNTVYNYLIKNDSGSTKIRSFKTSGSTSSFYIGWFGDMHADPADSEKPGIFNTLYSKLSTISNNNMPVIVFSGDLVKYSNDYDCWKEFDKVDALKNTIFAPVTGNKEYYKRTGSSSKTKYYSAEWFNDMVNYPDNGPDRCESTYYFIYNRVLFVNIDNCSSTQNNPNNYNASESEFIKRQQAWFENVCTGEKGNYDYIIVQEHYPSFYRSSDGDTVPASHGTQAYYPYFNQLFDKYGVDLVLAGDVHEYNRTYRIYNGKKSTDNNKGTVYATCSEFNGTSVVDASTVRHDSTNPLIEAYQLEISPSSAGIIKVTSSGLEYRFVNINGDTLDSVTIPKKSR
ncbi:MAG: PT domain-containing protein [Lachnospiraceae bacterium]|nr:PT domain-containing protein [Lachnospiraceae bacterium]